jgi:hypothetical protein
LLWQLVNAGNRDKAEYLTTGNKVPAKRRQGIFAASTQEPHRLGSLCYQLYGPPFPAVDGFGRLNRSSNRAGPTPTDLIRRGLAGKVEHRDEEKAQEDGGGHADDDGEDGAADKLVGHSPQPPFCSWLTGCSVGGTGGPETAWRRRG